jgi:hypothetical protein
MKNICKILIISIFYSTTVAGGNKQKDVMYLYTLSGEATKAAYDEAVAVSCIQGIVNRGNPTLYVLSNPYSCTNPMKYWDLSKTYSRPAYWLEIFSKDGEWLSGKKKNTITSLDALVKLAKKQVKGAVIWDPDVPATINVATTMAGVEDLIVLSPEIADKYLKVWKLPVIKDFRGMFTGTETGSKKNDAYRWAIREYVENGKCNPHRLFSKEDAATAREKGFLDDVVTRDWAVCNRSFVYDLSPWIDEALDDPEQPVGTDYETHKMLLSATMKQAKGEQMTEVAGFSYFFKYYFAEPKPKHIEVHTEWEMIYLISPYNCYQNTLTEYSYNQSFHSQAPDPKLTQGRPALGTPKDGKTYICFLMADYDSSTPLYDFLPNHWNDKTRGQIPLTWGIDPSLYEIYPDIIQYMYKTKSPNDFFAPDASAAGYMNPNRIDEANLPLFIRHNKKHYEKLDMSLSPMVLDWDEPSPAVKDAFTQFSPDGFATIVAGFHGPGGKQPVPHVWKGMPVTKLTMAKEFADLMSAKIPQSKGTKPAYYIFRLVWKNPQEIIDMIDKLKQARPELDIEVVDPYNFFHYFKTTYQN